MREMRDCEWSEGSLMMDYEALMRGYEGMSVCEWNEGSLMRDYEALMRDYEGL